LISRRGFLTGVSWLVLLNSQVLAGINNPGSAGAASPFNGGRTQFNTTGPQSGGDYTFINLMKMSQGWSYNSPPSGTTAPPVPISELDSNGYITSVVAGTTGVYTVFQMPSQSQYGGTWILQWDGGGTLQFGAFGVANVTPGSGVTWDGLNLVSTGGTGNSATFTVVGNPAGGAGVRVKLTNASPNHVRNILVCKFGNSNVAYGYSQDDYTLYTNGLQFSPQHLALVKSARPGVIRSLGWGGASQGTNGNNIATWAQRRPKGYVSYGGFYHQAALYTGTTTHSGSDYTLSSAGFSLTNKIQVYLQFDATSPQNGLTNISWSTTNTVAINIPWTAHGLSVGNTVCFGNTGQTPAALNSGQTYFINNVVDANNFTVSATSGGASVVANATTSGTMRGVSIPRININGTGFVPITGQQTPFPDNVFIGFGTVFYPSVGGPSGSISYLIYDATVGYFYLTQGGCVPGVPPEVFMDYCAAIGSYPHITAPFLSLEPVSDFMTSWATYATSNYPWMKPRIEPYNETWQSNAAGFGTFYALSLSFALWGTEDYNQAYGKWCSTLGQAISALYGNDRTKYSMLDSQATGAVFDGTSTPGASVDSRLKSTNYVSINGGSPAYKWVDRVVGANYFVSAQVDNVLEPINAFAYSVTDAGNPTAQAATVNSYVAACSGNSGPPFPLGCIEDVVNSFLNIKTWALATVGSGSTVAGITCYEGGYGPNYPVIARQNTFSAIAAATKASPCVLTLGASTGGDNNPLSSSGGNTNPAVVGMMLDISGVAGMTQLNGSSGTATFTTSSANITWTPTNPLVIGQLISFNSNSFPAGGSIWNTLNPAPAPLVAGQPYFVVSTSPLQVSATKGGAAITITDASVLSATAQSGWLVTAVSGNSVTIDVDSSAFGAFSATGSPIAQYDNSFYYVNVLRFASKSATGLGAQNTACYNQLAALAGPGFVSEYPSNFLYTGFQNSWSILDPDIYAPLTSQWNSIVAFN
jgi:hypothetical protein